MKPLNQSTFINYSHLAHRKTNECEILKSMKVWHKGNISRRREAYTILRQQEFGRNLALASDQSNQQHLLLKGRHFSSGYKKTTYQLGSSREAKPKHTHTEKETHTHTHIYLLSFGNWIISKLGSLARLNFIGQANSLEHQVEFDAVKLKQNSFSEKPQLLYLRLSVDWMRPTHVTKVNLDYRLTEWTLTISTKLRLSHIQIGVRLNAGYLVQPS